MLYADFFFFGWHESSRAAVSMVKIFFQISGYGGLLVEHSIAVSIFTYKLRLIDNGGFTLRVVYLIDYVF